MGVVIPPIRLRDNLQLGANEYRFLLKGNPLSRGELMPGYWLAMNATNSRVTLKGVPTVEPVFHLPATWITDVERKNAEVAGFTVVDAASVLVTHLSETIKRNCHEILSRQDVQMLLDNLKQTNPTVVNELIPAQLTVGQVQRILQHLLAEGDAGSHLRPVPVHEPGRARAAAVRRRPRRPAGGRRTCEREQDRAAPVIRSFLPPNDGFARWFT
jgi:flagellar biosynthesis protein FlhA